MKKKLFIACICLTIGYLLSACTKETNEISIGSEEDENPLFVSQTVSDDISSISPDNINVKAQVQLYEGKYFDESVYKYVDIPEADSPLVYCEIMISNITDTSFDFTIYETIMATGESRIIFPTGTAVFIGNGTEAVYYGDEQTFNFLFPDNQAWYPEIRDIKVNGFAELEGKTYINNNIPGHEAG